MTTETLTEAQRRDAWLAKRRSHITSSDLAAIMGLPDAYGSPMKVFLEKKNLLEKGETPDWLEAGLRLQPVILNWYADRVGVAIAHADPYDLVVCKEQPILAASLDAQWWVNNALGPCVDAKNVRFKRPEEWGPEGSDEIPGRYVVQLHSQMLCTGQRIQADLATLFGGADPSYFTVPYDQEIAAGIVEAGVSFWTKHVQADIPPPVDASDDWTRWLNSRPSHGDYIEATPEAKRWRAEALEASRKKKLAEEDEKTAKNRIRAFIGEAPGMLVREVVDGKEIAIKVHYKPNRPSQEIDWEAVARSCGAPDSIIAQFTNPKPGARPLRLGKDE